jgi:hypothetical protein
MAGNHTKEDHFRDRDALLREVARIREIVEITAAELAGYLVALRHRTETETALLRMRMAAPAPVYAPRPRYMGGRWVLRDGDTYGAVQAQPPVVMPSPMPEPHPGRGDFRSLEEES